MIRDRDFAFELDNDAIRCCYFDASIKYIYCNENADRVEFYICKRCGNYLHIHRHKFSSRHSTMIVNNIECFNYYNLCNCDFRKYIK